MSGNFILYVDYKKNIKVTKKSKINVDTCNICKLKNLTPTQKKRKRKKKKSNHNLRLLIQCRFLLLQYRKCGRYKRLS